MWLQHSLEDICSACVVANNPCQQLGRGRRATGLVWLPILLPLLPIQGSAQALLPKITQQKSLWWSEGLQRTSKGMFVYE